MIRIRILSLAVFALAIGLQSLCIAQDHDTTFSEMVQLSGKVVDSSGDPIKKFRVIVRLFAGVGSGQKATNTWDAEFENGQFSFDIEEPLELGKRGYMTMNVTADGYIRGNPQYKQYRQLTRFEGDFDKTTLKSGMKVIGKLALPDNSAEKKIVKPRIIMVRKMTGWTRNFNNAFHTAVKVKEDGTFETLVPENCSIEILAFSQNAASTHKTVKIQRNGDSEEQDLGTIKLSAGVCVEGTVLSKDGKPVEGQLVSIDRTYNTSNYFALSVNGHATTDAEGKFKLPPRTGKQIVSITKQIWQDGDAITPKGGKAIAAAPVEITLKKDKPAEPITIQEIATWKVTGSVAGSGDTKMENTSLWVTAGRNQNQYTTDDKGKFEFEVPDGLEVTIYIFGSSGGTVQFVTPTKKTLKSFRKHFKGPLENRQIITLKDIHSDIGPLDLTMVPRNVETISATDMFWEWLLFGS